MPPIVAARTAGVGFVDRRGVEIINAGSVLAKMTPSRKPAFKSVAASAVMPMSMSTRTISAAATMIAITMAGKRKMMRLVLNGCPQSPG